MTSKGPSRAGSDSGEGPAPAESRPGESRLGDGAQRRFHGRRRGRPLRKGRSRLVETLLPELLIRLPDDGLVDLPALFDTPRKAYWLEIGFGAGEHLAWQAEAHPDIGFIGCEAFVNGVASLLRHIEQRSLGNIRIFDDDAKLLLTALGPSTIERLFLLHPDPWPKRRHRDRRLVQSATVRRFAQLMPPGGILRIATDHPVYLGWTLRIMGRQPWFDWTAESAADWLERPADWPQTRYEAKALKEGRRCTYLNYRRNRVAVNTSDPPSAGECAGPVAVRVLGRALDGGRPDG